MNKRAFVSVLVLLVFATSARAQENSPSKASTATPTSVNASHATMPLPFTKNEGQWPDDILFRTDAGGATVWLTATGAYYQFTRRVPLTASVGAVSDLGDPGHFPAGKDRGRDSVETLVIKATFAGANPHPEVIADGALEYKCNYFFGDDPAKWRANVPNYNAVTLTGIYPGIDVKYSADVNGRAVYEFIAAPGVELSQIEVAYEGAETALNAEAKLIVSAAWGELMEAITVPANGAGVATPLYSSTGHTTGLDRPALHRSEAQSANVELAYSTYLGGGGDDEGRGIAVDAAKYAFVTGNTTSADFPTVDPFQTDQGVGDIFVTKINTNGSSLIYSTYLGGGALDQVLAIVLDANSNAYVTGLTGSSNFPTLDPFQMNQGSVDGFVCKLSPSGSTLVFSTYLGGSSYDECRDIAVNDTLNCYVTGYTASTDFPTLNPYQTDQGMIDAFVTKFTPDGMSIDFSTYIGGALNDYGSALELDPQVSQSFNDVYVTGHTASTDFPTVNPYQGTHQGGGADAFVSKLGSTGSSLSYSSYLGGAGGDYAICMDVDDSGRAQVGGYTSSSNFPTVNPYQATFQGGTYDGFVAVLSSSGGVVDFSTFIGGINDEVISYLITLAFIATYVGGYSDSPDLPTVNAYQGTNQGFMDAFCGKFIVANPELPPELRYFSYLGGSSNDGGEAAAVDAAGDAYVLGTTVSANYPTLNSYQGTFQGGSNDAFVTKLKEPSCCDVAGDADSDGAVSIGDVVYIGAHIFQGLIVPQCYVEGDLDGNGSIEVGDALYLMFYIFGGGPAPFCQ